MRDEPLDTPLPTAFSFLPPPEDRCAQCPEYSKKQVRSVVGCFVCAFIGLLIFSSLLATWFAGQMDMNSVNSTHTHTHTSSSTSTTTTTTTSSATTSNSGTTQTPAGYDECLSNSWAPAGVSRLVSAVSANPDQLLVDTNFQTAATFLFNAFRASSSRFSVGLMYGLPNGDCYSLMDCSADSFINSAPCTGVTRYFLFIRNQAYFGDTVLRAFAVNTTNGKLASNYYYTGTVPYDTTARPWYVQQQGWSAVYQFADMAIQGRSYSTTLPLSSGGSVVIAGDRVSTEPCGACLAASFAVPWAEGWASQNQYGKNALTSQASVNGYLTSMLSYVRQFSNETFYSVYVGFSSNDFYQIIDCANPSATLTCRNRINAANSPYIAIVRNQAVFGTSNRVSFEMTASGGVGAQIETLSAFPTTTRPWYLIGHGWSDIYTFVSNGQQGRSYSANFNDGVAAADAILDSSQRCSLGRLTCS